MKQVLYLSYDGMTDPLGQSQVLPYLVGLSKEGYSFTLVSFEKKNRFEKDSHLISEICSQHNIDWRPLFYTKKPPVLSTVYDLFKLNQLVRKLHQSKQFSLVHCRSYLTALIGLGLKKRTRIKMVFDMRGFWADERLEGGIWSQNNIIFRAIYNYFKRKEKAFFQLSDAAISLTHKGKETILSWNLPAVSDAKITVIPCCVDLSLFDPSTIHLDEKKLLKDQLGLTNSFVIGYIGSIGTWYMLDEMFLAFKQIKQQQPNALFLFVTRENESYIVKKAEQIGLNRNDIKVISAQHKEVPLFVSLFDCSIFFIRPSFSKIASSPTKQGEIMAMGIPIICNSGVGDTDKVVIDYLSGQLIDNVENTDWSSFQLDFSTFNREKTQKGAREFYGLTNGILRYKTVYESLLSINQSEN